MDGEVTHNIHHKSGNRGDDSEVSEIHQNVILTLKRLDDPAGPFRGARQQRRLAPSDEFIAYCFEQYSCTIHRKGVKLENC